MTELNLKTNKHVVENQPQPVAQKYQLCIQTRRYAYLTAWFSGTDEDIKRIAEQEQKCIKGATVKVIE